MSHIEPANAENATAPSQSRPGETSRFRLLQSLGAGGMGEVHLAEDLSLRRKVAIKSIRTQLCQDPDVLKRIERECLLHAKIGTHPHIVTLYDRIEDEGRIQLVMEFVEGETLYSLLDRLAKEGKRLSLTQGIAIAVQTLEALARIHTHGIVHRDIKPANIMISHDDCGEYCAKLMDFGLARANDDGMTALTQTGMGGPGTPLYMAPEQIDPKVFGQISPATDVYAMGIMLYQIISGGPPFTGSITEIFNGHLNARPLRLDAKADPGVPTVIADIIERALAKRQENRYASANAFREALLSINTDMAGATATGYRPPAYVETTSSGAPKTMAAHDAAQLSGMAPGQTMMHGAGARGKSNASGSRGALIAVALLVGVVALAGAGGYWLYNSRSGETTTVEESASNASAADPAPADPAPVAEGPASTSVSVTVKRPVPDANSMPSDVQQPVPVQGAVAPADIPSTPPVTPIPDAASATVHLGPSYPEPTESAVSVFEQMRQEKRASDPSLAAEPAPKVTAPAAAKPTPPEPAAAKPAAPEPVTAKSAPAEPAAAKPAPAEPKPAAKIIEDKPAPKPAVQEPKPEPPTKPGSGFSVVGKEAVKVK